MMSHNLEVRVLKTDWKIQICGCKTVNIWSKGKNQNQREIKELIPRKWPPKVFRNFTIEWLHPNKNYNFFLLDKELFWKAVLTQEILLYSEFCIEMTNAWFWFFLESISVIYSRIIDIYNQIFDMDNELENGQIVYKF